jgi:hypothetical protein
MDTLNNNNSIDLSQFDDDFRNAQSDDSRGDFETVPDGSYQVRIDNVELRKSSRGNPMLTVALRILGPRCANRLLWKNIAFTQKSMKFAKADLYTCGLKLNSLSELYTRMMDLLDVKLEVTKKTKDDNENIYLNRRIEGDHHGRRNGGDASVPF